MIHYYRPQGDYGGWGLHSWNEDRPLPGVTWERPLPQTGTDDFGVYWHIALKNFPDGRVNFIIHRGDVKDQCGKDMSWNVKFSMEIWVVSPECRIHLSKEEALGARR